VKPFRKLRKVHNQGKRTRLRDLIRYDLRQMHAAFTGTLPVGSTSEPLGQQQVSHAFLSLFTHATWHQIVLELAATTSISNDACCLCDLHHNTVLQFVMC